MLEFIISNYIIFIVIAIVLLLGLFGYLMDRKKYDEYKEEILNSDKQIAQFESHPDIQNIATPVQVDQSIPQVQASSDPVTGSIQN